MNKIKQLRAEGFKVGVTHYRTYLTPEGFKIMCTRRAAEENGTYTGPLSEGGRTVVQVTTPEATEPVVIQEGAFRVETYLEPITAEGEAVVGKKDKFNKRLGTTIALGRSLKKLEQLQEERDRELQEAQE